MSYKRSKESKRRLKKLYKKTKTKLAGGVYYDTEKKRYIRYSASEFGNAKKLRTRANRKVRHMTDIQSGSGYKKAFDYWWTLF